MGRKKRKVWLWLAVERASRRVVALGTGPARRDHGPALVAGAAPALTPLLFRLVSGSRWRAAALAAPPLPEG
ncbi:hypothetical protein [Hymenobacter lapidarius]|uniref:hypothetical protein n=1 Tax=Hymenobacter lapidarius TaxID=1908237 RepID=UPI00195B5924